MARIAGVDLPNKNVDIALTYIFGIGHSTAKEICKKTGIDSERRINDLSTDEIASLRKAIEYNPENAMVYNYLGYLFAEKNMNLDESIELIQKALSLSPSNGAYLDSLGWAYYKKGDFKLALKKLLLAEKQLDKDKIPDPVVYDHIGDVYHKIGEREKALEYWEKSINLKKDSKIQEKIKESYKK